MRAPVGVLVAVCLALMLMDESEAFPSSKEELTSVELSRPARRLLAVSNDVDRALEQAERLGSGKSTYDHLTAQGTKDPWQTMVTGAMPTPPPQMDALALFNQEASKALEGPGSNDPLSQFQARKVQLDATSANAGKLEVASTRASLEAQREKNLLQSMSGTTVPTSNILATSANGQLALPQSAHPQVVSLSEGSDLTSALADFDREQTATLVPKVHTLQMKSKSMHVAPLQMVHEMGGDPDEEDDLGDLGESDSVSESAGDGEAQTSLNSQIDREAAEAAQSVLKETMKNVESDFLMSEKQLTKDADSAPALTMAALRKPSAAAAREKKEREQNKANLMEQNKKMKLTAKLAYDKAIGAAHKVAKQQLDQTLAGLKMQLSVKKKSIEEEAKIKTEQARQKMLDKIRTAEVVAVNRLQATLPMKLAKVKEEAQQKAEHVAALAIGEVTKANAKIRASLERQLGEANDKLNAAKLQLTNSDVNPGQALKNAVAVKTEKAHVRRLGELANVALAQQKAHSASEVTKAQQDAKESVRLAMKSAQKTELAAARKQMGEDQAHIRAAAEKVFNEDKAQIEEDAHAQVEKLQKSTKDLVDAAIQRAPLREQELHRKTTKAYKKAIHAADNLLAKQLAKLTPDVTITDGSKVNLDIAESAVENPSGSKAFTLENQNFEAAAKYAARQARKAKEKLDQTKKHSQEILAELAKETKEARVAAEKAERLDEKVTQVKLAKLQLHEAQAAAAFNKAARAHFQEELAKKQMATTAPKAQDASVTNFKESLKALQQEAKSATVDAFEQAKKSAKELQRAPGT